MIDGGPVDEPAEKLKPRTGGVTEVDLTENPKTKPGSERPRPELPWQRRGVEPEAAVDAAGHLLAQLHALAVADVPLLLQVLRLRHPSGAPLLARGGRAAARRGGPPQRQGAARPDRRAARGQPARRGTPRAPTVTRTSPPTSPGPASARSSAACSRTRTSASSTAPSSARLREVTASQGLMLESISERLMETVHAGSPTKHPEQSGWRRSRPPASCGSRSPAGS